MKIDSALVLVIGLALSACAQTNIQPMSKDTFKVSTVAAPACGQNGARNVTFRTAAIEVIRRGGDKFIIIGDTANSEFWTGDHNQAMVVKVIAEGTAEARNALSAREQLGPTWQEALAKGAPVTCE